MPLVDPVTSAVLPASGAAADEVMGEVLWERNREGAAAKFARCGSRREACIGGLQRTPPMQRAETKSRKP